MMHTHSSRSTRAAFACCVLAASHAQGVHPGDVILEVQNGRIVTGSGYAANNAFIPERVFLSELGLAFPNFSGAPGFDCNPGTFPAGSRNGFRILDALRQWDGTSFSTIPAERMELAFSTLNRLTPTAPSVVEGFLLVVGSNGQWHRHLEYTLQAPASDGVYLLSLQLSSNAGTIQESEPFWIVFDQNAPASDVASATAWVQDNLVNAPQPCSDIDFNNDGLFPDTADIDDLLSVFSGGACSNPAGCDTIDFNADGLFPDTEDIDDFLTVFGGGTC
jgi:hypothetical protein